MDELSPHIHFQLVHDVFFAETPNAHLRMKEVQVNQMDSNSRYSCTDSLSVYSIHVVHQDMPAREFFALRVPSHFRLPFLRVSFSLSVTATGSQVFLEMVFE